uniref:ARAD1C09130p n=1 Tax=Blastobotrys adeninivorans TaxID=409370 RepID=A0A060T0L4_BLAAD
MPVQGPREPKFPSYSSRYSQPVPVQDENEAYAPPPPSSPKRTPEKKTSSPSDDNSDPLASLPADAHVKLVCVGDGGCGKTCLLVTYAHGSFPERYVPTVFENYLSKVRSPSGKVIELALWDTAGQEEYDRLRALSYPEANVVLVCFAIDSPVSLENVYDKWIPEVAHHCPDVPIIIVGLKSDLRPRHPLPQSPAVPPGSPGASITRSGSSRTLSAEQGNTAAVQCGAEMYMECSARTGKGVNDIFSTAMSIVLGERQRIPSDRMRNRQVSRQKRQQLRQQEQQQGQQEHQGYQTQQEKASYSQGVPGKGHAQGSLAAGAGKDGHKSIKRRLRKCVIV